MHRSKIMKAEPIVIESTIDAPSAKVWEAITNNDLMKQWYFNIADFKPEQGFNFEFAGENEGRHYRHLCTVIEVDEGKKLKHSQRYDGYEGDSYVTWELFSEGEKTNIKLTHEGVETFPSDTKDFARENFVMGWTEIVGNLLPKFLKG